MTPEKFTKSDYVLMDYRGEWGLFEKSINSSKTFFTLKHIHCPGYEDHSVSYDSVILWTVGIDRPVGWGDSCPLCKLQVPLEILDYFRKAIEFLVT